jgi:hypothetical protein
MQPVLQPQSEELEKMVSRELPEEHQLVHSRVVSVLPEVQDSREVLRLQEDLLDLTQVSFLLIHTQVETQRLPEVQEVTEAPEEVEVHLVRVLLVSRVSREAQASPEERHTPEASLVTTAYWVRLSSFQILRERYQQQVVLAVLVQQGEPEEREVVQRVLSEAPEEVEAPEEQVGLRQVVASQDFMQVLFEILHTRLQPSLQ